jgi:hypothetical protein
VVIENDNGRFKDHFDVNGAVPIRSQAATAHWVLGAVRDYHVTLLHRHNLGLDFRVGPKPELQVA